MTGLVSLVGAGPGDPDLLAVKALRRLREADVVLHDALVEPSLVALASRARRCRVGKRANRPSFEQETINALMVRFARRGQRVVRLKCGDPFVLGRGGEEALFLADAGVPFEVIPGVTSAIAAPALAGIPVTHRGLASGFLVVTGHSESTWQPILGSLAPLSVTLVVLMGLGKRAQLVAFLLERGWPPEVPAAVVLDASTSRERTWIGALAALGHAPICAGAAGVIVVGNVVSLAPHLASVAPPRAAAGQ